MKRLMAMLLTLMLLLCAGLTAAAESGNTGTENGAEAIQGPINQWAFEDRVEYVGGRIDAGAAVWSRALEDNFKEVYFELDTSYLTVGKTARWRINVKPTGYEMYVGLYWQDFSDTSYMYTYVEDSLQRLTSVYPWYVPKIPQAGRYMLVVEIFNADYSDSAVFQSAIYETASEEELLAQKVKTVVAECTNSGMSQYEKALNLHDWLCQNAEYDYTYTEFDAAGVLLRGKGVCESFARAYQMLLTEAGIRSTYVTGFANGQNHIWNAVMLDGAWCHVDVTWDEDSSDRFYFGMSEALISRDHQILDKPPQAATDAYNYALNRADGTFATVEELGELFMKLPGDQEEFMFYYIGNEQLGDACMDWCDANAARLGLMTWTYRYGPTCLHYIKGTRDNSNAIEIREAATGIQTDGTAKASFVIKTGQDAAALGMYLDNGALIKQYGSGYTDDGGERIWNFEYSFVNDGARTLIFKALDENGQVLDAKELTLALTGSRVNSAAFEGPICVGGTAKAVVKTNLGAKKLYMYSENGSLIKTWTAQEASRTPENERIWEIEYAFGGAGNRTMLFRASHDEKLISAGKKASITVKNPPAVMEARADEWAYEGFAFDVYIRAEEGAEYVHAYDADGRLLRTDHTYNVTDDGWVYLVLSIEERGVHELTLKASADRKTTGEGKKCSVRVVSGVGSAAFDRETVERGESAQITVNTEGDVEQLMMYSESGALIRTWPADYAYSTIVNGERIWTLNYTFTGAGKRTMTFRAMRNGTVLPDAQQAKVEIVSDYALHEAGFEAGVAYKGEKAAVRAVSGRTAKYLHMYSETGALAKKWSAEGNSELIDGMRVWNVEYAFGGAGSRKVTFRTSEDGKTLGAAKSADILIVSGAPAVSYAAFDRKEIEKGEAAVITVRTNADASQVKMYTEAGAPAKVWTASAANSKVNGTERIWTLSYAFGGAGERMLTFRATKDGSTMGAGKSAAVKIVSDYAMREAGFEASAAYQGEKTRAQAVTGRTAKYLHLYTSDGTPVKTWSAEGNSVVKDGLRVWEVEYAFGGGGSRKVLFRASEDGKKTSGSIEAGIVIATGAPAVSYAKFADASVRKGESVGITVKTNADATQVKMYSEAGALAKTWTANSSNSKVNGTERIWTLSYAFGGTGNRTLTFKAAKAGGAVGYAQKASVAVE